MSAEILFVEIKIEEDTVSEIIARCYDVPRGVIAQNSRTLSGVIVQPS